MMTVGPVQADAGGESALVMEIGHQIPFLILNSLRGVIHNPLRGVDLRDSPREPWMTPVQL